MSRLVSLSSAILFATLSAASVRARTPAIRLDTQPLPGFHPSPNSGAEAPRPAAARMLSRPAPLASADVMRLMPKLGLRSGPIQLYVQTIKYQLESWNTQISVEVDTPTVTDAIFSGANGYVQVDFSVQPNKQYLLDCSLGEDGTYKVGTTFMLPNNGSTGFLDGQLSSQTCARSSALRHPPRHKPGSDAGR